MKIDLLFVLNVPSFYKINLLNELSTKCSVYAVFIGYTDQVIIDNELDKKIRFPYTIINDCIVEKRNKVKTLLSLISCLSKHEYKFVIWGGWDLYELFPLMYIQAYNKNCFMCESSVYESVLYGIKGQVKKYLSKSFSHYFVSGYPHAEIFQKLKVTGEIHITGGVGLFNKPTLTFPKRIRQKKLNYIYTGRLIDVKNLEFLVSVFNETGLSLTIIGSGHLESKLRKMAKDNICFEGFVDNDKIYEYYASANCFILPSKSEPWGLVVEEALFSGIPVLVSDKVGCNVDCVEKYDSGIVFKADDKVSLKNALKLMEERYDYYCVQVEKIDFNERDLLQISTYLNILKK